MSPVGVSGVNQTTSWSEITARIAAIQKIPNFGIQRIELSKLLKGTRSLDLRKQLHAP